MADYKSMYLKLAAAQTEAIDLLQNLEDGVLELLQAVLQETEQIYIDSSDGGNEACRIST